MIKRTLRNERGSAFVELALVLPVLCLVLVGAVELGRIAYYSIEVSNAARAGVAYGSQGSGPAACTDPTDPTKCEMEVAAAAAAPDIKNLTFPTPPDGTNTPCSCETIVTVGTTTTAVSTPITVCGGTSSTSATQCAPSTVPGTTRTVVSYVELATQAQVSTMFHYPGIPTSYTLHGYAKMRVIQ